MQIVLGTISDMGQAMDWLKTTFMYARVSAAADVVIAAAAVLHTM